MINNEFSDNEDEWYFDSIMRYKRLNMFELQKTPIQLSVSDGQSICVVSACNNDQSEITQLVLPDKSETEDTLTNSSDLKLKCGIFTDTLVSQVQILHKESKIFSSEEEVNGINVYDLDTSSNQIKKCKHLNNVLLNPWIFLNYTTGKEILLSKDSKNNSFIVDLNLGITCKTINTVESHSIADTLVPLFVSSHMISFLNKRTGNVKFFDIRTNASCGQINTNYSSSYESFWTYTSDLYLPIFSDNGIPSSDQNTSKIFLLSSNGNLISHDVRNFNESIANHNFNLLFKKDICGKYLQLNCCPTDGNVVSFSGFDENVYVYRIGNEFERLFVHDGHSHVENCDKETLVSSHVWLSCKNESNILSCALNKSLHLWTF